MDLIRRSLPAERLIDFDMSVTHRHEVKLDTAYGLPSDQAPQVGKKNMILIVGDRIINLDSELLNVWPMSIATVIFVEPRESHVNRRAYQVASYWRVSSSGRAYSSVGGMRDILVVGASSS